MKYYLAYGSNMNTKQMAYRCPDAKVIGATYLNGYELFFAGREVNAVASIRMKKNGKVPVLIWSISQDDEKSLDRYEGFPTFYTKKIIRVMLNGEMLSTMVYVMTEKPATRIGRPSTDYFETIASGYREFGFDVRTLAGAAELPPQSEELERLESLSRLQWEGKYTVCPRCGDPLKPRLLTNALSRRADIYVCDECGAAEAVSDYFGVKDEISSWSCFKNQA